MSNSTVTDQGRSPLYPDELDRHFGMRVFSVDGINYVDAPEEGQVNQQNDDAYVTVLTGEEYRLDLIALRMYDDPTLWWIIAKANRIFNPFEELEAGMTLRIPSRRSVLGVENA